MAATCHGSWWAAVVLAATAAVGTARAAPTPPRVLLFQLGDDYGFNNVGFPHGPLNAGNPEMKTPTMDVLAMDGIRLERHYVYKFCSPTRSALLSGRVPVHVNQNNDCNDASAASGIDLRMTILPQKLKQAGYSTAVVGKWHCGARSVANLPVNRGFDYHLGFLKGGEDHFHQNNCAGGPNAAVVDLWEQHGPARGRNGTYSAFLYSGGVLDVIANFTTRVSVDKDAKLFVYLPWHNTHAPLEAPEVYSYPPYYNNSYMPRMQYNAMARALDDGMGNVTSAIKAAGLWNETLVFFSADNGGWLRDGGIDGANNWPLRGGKTTDFEGGVRSVSFLSGGYIPANLRGTRHYGLISVADWYATLCYLAGVSADDNADGVPPIDSLNMWPTLLLPNTNSSPRTSLPLSWSLTPTGDVEDKALIVGRYKIICGTQRNAGYWQGPVFPNSTGSPTDEGCPDCCLFDIVADETEHNDLRLLNPSQFALMQKALADMGTTYYQTNYSEPNTTCITNTQAETFYGGFIGPMCFKHDPLPPTPPPLPPRRLSISRSAPQAAGMMAVKQCLAARGGHIAVAPCTGTLADAEWVVEESMDTQGWIAHSNGTALAYIKLDRHPAPNVTTKADFCIRGFVNLNPEVGADNSPQHQGFTFDTATGTLRSTLCDSDLYMCLVVPSNGSLAHGGSCSDADATGWVETFV